MCQGLSHSVQVALSSQAKVTISTQAEVTQQVGFTQAA